MNLSNICAIGKYDKCTSFLSPLFSGSIFSLSYVCAKAAIKFLCESITPLETPVVPLV